jgi:alpha-L-rhamnosidase
MYPTVKAFINYLETLKNPTTGLLDLPKSHWSQTAYIDTFGYHNRYGQSTAVNSIYYDTLLKAAWIANISGDAERAEFWLTRATQLKDQLNLILFDPATNRYFSSLFYGEYVPPSAQAQAWALTYNLVPENEETDVADGLLELLSRDPEIPNVGIYGMYWVFEGLERAGRVQDAIDIIRLYYGYLVNKNATNLWERFDADQYYWASLSHGWGGSPTWFITTYVLGARWIGPGSRQVKPSFANMDFASGAIPLPDGLLTVSWDAQNCQNKILDVQSPEITSGQVVIPVLQDTTIVWGAQTIWEDGQPLHDAVELIGSDVYVSVSGGNQHFEIKGECVFP